MYCTRCGRPNPDEARYCSHCGPRLTCAANTGSFSDRSRGRAPTARRDHVDHLAGAGPSRVRRRACSPTPRRSDTLPPGTALLVVMRGPNAGSRFLLDSDFTTAGRHPDSDIFLDDVTVSRRHAEFYRHGDRFTVRDVGSLNGTYVNRERIEEAELIGGDEVQIGKFRLLFLTGQVGRPEDSERGLAAGGAQVGA